MAMHYRRMANLLGRYKPNGNGIGDHTLTGSFGGKRSMKRYFGLLVPLPIVHAMLLITASIWCMPDSTQALPPYLAAFNVRYSTVGSRLDTCGVCHVDPSTLLTVPKPLNDYGLAFQNGPDHTTNPDAALAAIEGANSDNDTLGLTNRQEIDNRFFPGDASDPVSLTVNTAGTGSGTVSRSNPGTLCGPSFWYANHDRNPAPNAPDPLSVPETVTLTATPASDSSFTGWNGACTGTSPCTVSMTQDLSVTATFIPQFTLTVVKAGTGSGTVTSSPAGLSCDNICIATSAAFDQGTSVTLTASTANDSNFTGWSLEGCSGTGTCTVSMIQARTVRATFTLQQFPLTVVKAGTGSGTVTSSPVGLNCGSTCSAPFDFGTSVTLTANAANDSSFMG